MRIFIFGLSFSLLLGCFYFQKLLPYIPQKEKAFSTDFHKTDTKIFFNALVLGKRKMPKGIRTKVRRLNLQHLFTPSGLHLGSLIFWVVLIGRKRGKKLLNILLPLLLTFLLLNSILFSLQRNIFIYFLHNKIGITKGPCLLIAIFLEFLILDFKRFSSLSFSFLFLAIFVYYKNSSPFSVILKLFLGQLFIFVLQDSEISLSIFLINLLITFFVSSIFPLALFLSILSIFKIQILDSLANFLSSISIHVIEIGNRIYDQDPLKINSLKLLTIIAIAYISYEFLVKYWKLPNNIGKIPVIFQKLVLKK